MKPPLLEFTVNAHEFTHLVFEVKVWRTYNELQLARARSVRSCRLPPDHALVEGFFHTEHRRHCDDLTVGIIHFAKPNLTLNTITHESVHAAVAIATWARPKSNRLENACVDDERALCLTEIVIEEALASGTAYITERIVHALRRNRLKILP